MTHSSKDWVRISFVFSSRIYLYVNSLTLNGEHHHYHPSCRPFTFTSDAHSKTSSAVAAATHFSMSLSLQTNTSCVKMSEPQTEEDAVGNWENDSQLFQLLHLPVQSSTPFIPPTPPTPLAASFLFPLPPPPDLEIQTVQLVSL